MVASQIFLIHSKTIFVKRISPERRGLVTIHGYKLPIRSNVDLHDQGCQYNMNFKFRSFDLQSAESSLNKIQE